MRDTDEHRTIDALLDGAEVLGGAYDDYDSAAARERIARGLVPASLPAASGTTGTSRAAEAPRTAEVPGAPEPTAPFEHRAAGPDHPAHPPASAPERGARRYRTAHEQASHDLDLAISLVVGAPQAATSLAHLVDHRCADPEGALVFACLLHLVGHREAAQFWWQFAAGGGSRTAAFCLYLHHRRLAEFRDADHWRDQAARLARGPRRRTAAAPDPHTLLLPDTVRRDLLRQCHRGRHPHLPPTVEAVINRLPVIGDDEDFGEIPQPVSHLPAALARPQG